MTEVSKSHDPERRRFLKTAAVVAAFGAGILTPSRTTETQAQKMTHLAEDVECVDETITKTVYEVGAEIHGSLTRDRIEKVVEKGMLIPEDERTGKNLIVGVTNLSPERGVEQMIGPIFKSLEEGTNIHLVIARGNVCGFQEFVRKQYPHINLKIYKIGSKLHCSVSIK